VNLKNQDHHRDAEKNKILFSTTEDTEITEFLLLFLLRASVFSVVRTFFSVPVVRKVVRAA
jgi:hypothetical protein